MAEKLMWKDHPRHLKDLFREISSTSDHADVTLVCDDQVQVRAHRMVLSSCSSVLKKILMSWTLEQQPVISLMGVQVGSNIFHQLKYFLYL